MKKFNIKDYVLNFAVELLAIDSPSGYCMDAIKFVKNEVQQLSLISTNNDDKRKTNPLVC